MASAIRQRFAGALPSYVIAELLGIPLDDGRRLYAITEPMNTGPLGGAQLGRRSWNCSPTPPNSRPRKRAEPGDDIATALLHAEVDGERLTDFEFNLFFMLLLNAGGDTTRNLVAAGTLALIEHPGRVGAAGRRPVADADRHRGDAAVDQPGPGVHPHRDPGHRFAWEHWCARVSGWRCSTRRPTGTRPTSTAPSASTSAAPRILTWHSAAAAPTSVLAPAWPGWRRMPSSRNPHSHAGSS